MYTHYGAANKGLGKCEVCILSHNGPPSLQAQLVLKSRKCLYTFFLNTQKEVKVLSDAFLTLVEERNSMYQIDGKNEQKGEYNLNISRLTKGIAKQAKGVMLIT